MILDGRVLSKKILEEVRSNVSKGLKIRIEAIAYEEDKESIVYFNSIKRNAEKVGISFNLRIIEGEKIMETIESLNGDDSVNGIIVGRPFPKGVTNEMVSLSLDPDKDIDCVTSQNLGLLNFGVERLAPATPKGALDLLEYHGVEIKGRNVLVINRSVTVGRPLSAMLLNRDATVTIAHSKTSNIKSLIDESDIIFLAVGKPGYLKSSSLKGHKTIVDIGINVVEGKVVGDFEPDVENNDFAYTPVPGGVGTVTSAEILRNAVSIAQYQ